MIGLGGIALRPEHIAHAEGHGVGSGGAEGEHLVAGDQAGAGHVLSVDGGLPPQGVIEVFKDKALVGQLVKGGGQILVYHVLPEGLSGDEDEVLSGEHPRILVLTGGGASGYPLVHGLDGGIACVGGQGVKVDVEDVVLVDDGFRLRFGGGCVGSFRFGIRLRLGNLGGEGLLTIFHGQPEQPVADIQPQGGQQTEMGHGQLGNDFAPVDTFGRHDAAAGDVDGENGKTLGQNGGAQKQQLGLCDAGGQHFGGVTALWGEDIYHQQNHGNGQQKQSGEGVCDPRQRLPPVAADGVTCHSHAVQRQKGLENSVIDCVDPEPEGDDPHQDGRDDLIDLGTAQSGQAGDQKADSKAEQRGINRPAAQGRAQRPPLKDQFHP